MPPKRKRQKRYRVDIGPFIYDEPEEEIHYLADVLDPEHQGVFLSEAQIAELKTDEKKYPGSKKHFEEAVGAHLLARKPRPKLSAPERKARSKKLKKERVEKYARYLIMQGYRVFWKDYEITDPNYFFSEEHAEENAREIRQDAEEKAEALRQAEENKAAEEKAYEANDFVNEQKAARPQTSTRPPRKSKPLPKDFGPGAPLPKDFGRRPQPGAALFHGPGVQLPLSSSSSRPHNDSKEYIPSDAQIAASAAIAASKKGARKQTKAQQKGQEKADIEIARLRRAGIDVENIIPNAQHIAGAAALGITPREYIRLRQY